VAEWTLFAVCLSSSRQVFATEGLPSGSGRVAIAVLVVLLISIVVVTRVPRVRAKVMPHLRSAWATLRGVVRSPARTLGILVPGAIAPALFALCLGFCLRAYGAELPLATLVVVNTGASTLAGISPVPGGMGVAEAGLVAGLTAAGIPVEIATAAVITHRLITFWLPPVGGWLAMRGLARRELI
jgi:uncharacterized membrane protein YbhN (UPF0104 family)